jgi:hypothetical protein
MDSFAFDAHYFGYRWAGEIEVEYTNYRVGIICKYVCEEACEGAFAYSAFTTKDLELVLVLSSANSRKRGLTSILCFTSASLSVIAGISGSGPLGTEAHISLFGHV